MSLFFEAYLKHNLFELAFICSKAYLLLHLKEQNTKKSPPLLHEEDSMMMNEPWTLHPLFIY